MSDYTQKQGDKDALQGAPLRQRTKPPNTEPTGDIRHGPDV